MNSSDSACTECLSRRQFVAIGAAGTTTVLLGRIFAGRVRAEDEDQSVALTELPRTRIGQLSSLKTDERQVIQYPDDGPHRSAMLIKLGKKAGGGVGPDGDVVAFSTVCSHMGGDLSETYDSRFKVAGPCPEHLTTFDLTRHGMIVAGHATQSLPQLVLELDGDDIYATGVIGLLYGYSQNI